MKPNWDIKKIILIFIFLLICCDVSLLFAAQTGSDTSAVTTQQQLAQVQQLQQETAIPPASAAPSSQAIAQNQSFAPAQNMAPSQNQFPAPAQPAVSQYQNLPPPGTLNQTLTPAQAFPPPNQSSLTSQQPVAGPGAAISGGPLPPQQLTGANGSDFNAGQGTTQPSSTSSTPSGMVSEQDLNNQAFNAMVKNQLPMSPEQIQRLRELFNQSQFAAASTPGVPPKPVATSQLVNLEPGSTPPVIRLAQGFITSLVFIDSTGAPWPIEAYDIGNPSAFNIQWNKSDNTLMIQSTTLYTYGNLAVRLQGLPTPVMITLIPGGKAVDYRVDLRIPGTGPNAIPVPVTGLPSSANPELLGVLDGVPPSGSTEYEVCGGGAQAWVRGEQLFVRTHYTLLSPGWIATMSSADGMKAYQLQKAPLLLVAENGKIVQLKIQGL